MGIVGLNVRVNLARHGVLKSGKIGFYRMARDGLPSYQSIVLVWTRERVADFAGRWPLRVPLGGRCGLVPFKGLKKTEQALVKGGIQAVSL